MPEEDDDDEEETPRSLEDLIQGLTAALSHHAQIAYLHSLRGTVIFDPSNIAFIAISALTHEEITENIRKILEALRKAKEALAALQEQENSASHDHTTEFAEHATNNTSSSDEALPDHPPLTHTLQAHLAGQGFTSCG